jgi:hypothetical protein
VETGGPKNANWPEKGPAPGAGSADLRPLLTARFQPQRMAALKRRLRPSSVPGYLVIECWLRCMSAGAGQEIWSKPQCIIGNPWRSTFRPAIDAVVEAHELTVARPRAVLRSGFVHGRKPNKRSTPALLDRGELHMVPVSY